METLKVDIGCRYAKRPGFIEVDKEASDGVDHVADVEREALPFADRTVATIFSAHCFEHLGEHALLFNEISRVAVNDARLGIWTPYAWTRGPTRRSFTRTVPSSTSCTICTPAICFPSIGVRSWERTGSSRRCSSSSPRGCSPTCTVTGRAWSSRSRYMKGIAVEFGVHIRIWHDDPPPRTPPRRTHSRTRDGARLPVATPVAEGRVARIRKWLLS
jgi:SAM-dependent methyltransferase